MLSIRFQTKNPNTHTETMAKSNLQIHTNCCVLRKQKLTINLHYHSGIIITLENKTYKGTPI